MFYAFETDPELIIADLHENGQSLYPGTGEASETGRGAAVGTKFNVPLPAGAGDADFARVWPQMLAHVERLQPQFILLQCGADSLAGDPMAHLKLSAASHARAARELCELADRVGHGRVLALGGGGYDRANLARRGLPWSNRSCCRAGPPLKINAALKPPPAVRVQSAPCFSMRTGQPLRTHSIRAHAVCTRPEC